MRRTRIFLLCLVRILQARSELHAYLVKDEVESGMSSVKELSEVAGGICEEMAEEKNLLVTKAFG